MTGVQQDFDGAVFGPVAGRDIHQHGPTTIHAQIFPPRPESQLQAEFHRHTGIWCPAGARKVFEELMADRGFTAPELAAAWKDNALGWDSAANRIIISTHWFNVAGGYLMIASLLFYLVIYGVPLFFSDRGLTAFVALCLAIGMFGGGACLAFRYVIWPQRVASRVARALGAKAAS